MKTNLKRVFVRVLCAASLALCTNAAFTKTNTYTKGQFKDVKDTAWYEKEVASAFELGFMNGTAFDVFSPDGNVTVAQGITMASRVNASYNAREINTDGNDWYDGYVYYAKKNGLITENQFDNYNRNITRAEMASLFANAVPKNEFASKNDVKFIPDVNVTSSYAEDLLMLYKAGVVMGSDAYGTFNPDADIKRSEAAAIINRVAIPENRLSKTLKEYNIHDAYQLVYNEGNYVTSIVGGKTGTHESLDSGWALDNRGGAPRISIEETVSSVVDISDTEGTALIKEINKTEDERLVSEFECTAHGDGAYIEYRDEDGKPVYSIKVVDGKWSVLSKDGKYTSLCKASTGKRDNFRLYFDQRTGKAKTYINNEYFGESELLSDNILNFRYAVDEKSRTALEPGKINIVANYGVYEIFDIFGIEEAYGWKKDGNVTVKNGEIVMAGKSSLSKPFEVIDTKYIAEVLAIFPVRDEAGFRILSGNNTAVEFKKENGVLYANGKAVYEKVTPNMWYRLRVEANPTLGIAEVVVNGREMCTVPLYSNAPVDTFEIVSVSGNARFDDIRVYADADHFDYVPQPEIKADFSDYIVGLNVCNLWRDNGKHFGWACITPYDENRPVLGYYDEGSVECADWEIKYMVDHGIDVQAMCWYIDNTDGPIKTPRLSYQLNDALQHAKYQDYMKYCIIMECGSGYTTENFRKYIVPYWFENYFLDENYFILDNKIVLDMFGSGSLKSESKFGSTEAVRRELSYLNEKAKEYGFDGVMYIDNGTPQTLEEFGIEYRSAYHWLSPGSSFEVNRDMNIGNNEASDKVYQIPTISMGYNDLAWMNDTGRKPLMTVEDYDKSFTWVKNEYIPKYAKKGTFEEKLVWLSTWNEYGEGTYIMPSGLNEFGYLDVLRKHFTNLPEKHDDFIPTEEQAKRINRLYPQYARYLRRQQSFEYNKREPVYTVEKTFEVKEDSIKLTNCKDASFGPDGVTAISSSDDFQIHFSEASRGVDLKNITGVRVHAKVPAGNYIHIYYGTYADNSHSEKKSARNNTTTSEMTTYDFDFSTQPEWQGTLTSLRLDPSNGKNIEFTVKKLEFLADKTEVDYQKKIEDSPKLFVNGVSVQSAVLPETKNGKRLFAFDPETSMHNILHTFMTWNHAEKSLTLEADGKKVKFTVGSDKYIADGKEKSLGYTLYQTDGLPMLDFDLLCDEFGFDYSFDKTQNRADVTTDEIKLYEEMKNRSKGTWDFNSYSTEGWSSSTASVSAKGEYITFDNKNTGKTDPAMTVILGEGFKALKYPKAEIRIRYEYETDANQPFTFYFLTDADSTWNEKKALWTKQKSNGKSDGWEVYTIDFSTLGTWKNNITSIRFDPFNTIGSMDIDYIRFIEDPDFIDVDMSNITDIINGDAEKVGLITFTSSSASITNVVDSKNENNRVYKVIAPKGKSWTYFRHEYPLESGKTYKFSYDVRALPDTRGESVDLKVVTNIRYYEEGVKSNDHTIKGHTVPKDGSWVHVEDTFTVGKLSSNLLRTVTFFAEPTSESSAANFEVDNVKVEIVG